MLRKLKVALVAAVLGLGGTLFLTSPAQATTGGVDIVGWCKYGRLNGALKNDSWGAWPTNPSNAYSWICHDYTQNFSVGVDMNAACAYSHPGHPGWAVVGNATNPYSWYCLY